MDENALETMHRMIDVDNIISKREVRHQQDTMRLFYKTRAESRRHVRNVRLHRRHDRTSRRQHAKHVDSTQLQPLWLQRNFACQEKTPRKLDNYSIILVLFKVKP